MRVDEFDYALPEELIAQEPLEPRDASRLLVLDGASGTLQHSVFRRIGELLHPGDMSVLNDTKVLPARLYAHKESGAMIELLLLKQCGLDTWQCLVRPGRKALPGTKLLFALPALNAEIIGLAEEGTRLVHFQHTGDFYALLEQLGTMPLPPYIKKPLVDQERYQPVYARERGSAAAPTAGLHFTERLLQELQAQGILIEKVLLHVGLGTFRPVKVEDVTQHHMHSEWCCVSQETVDIVNETKRRGGRVVSVGTTSCRTLESMAKDGKLLPGTRDTDIFIYPPYEFQIVDALITNFHLPESTLLMLVSALAGREHILEAYRQAVEMRYRFFSFGDAMLIQ